VYARLRRAMGAWHKCQTENTLSWRRAHAFPRARLLTRGHGALSDDRVCCKFTACAPLPTLRIQDSSREPRTGRKVGGFRPVASSKLRPVGLDAQHFEASIGADDREAVGLDRDDLAHLAGDAFGIARRQRLGLEDLERLAAEIGPCAGSRIAAAY